MEPNLDTGADLAGTADGLANGRAGEPGKVPARNRRTPDNGSSGNRAAVAEADAGNDGRVEVADGQKSPAWDKDASLFLRLMRAQQDAKKLEKKEPKKSGWNDNKGLPYSFISHDDVTHEAKRILGKHGVLFFPMLKEMTQDGNRTRATVEGVFMNVDNEGDRLTVLGVGYGVDGGDKGPGKALSYAKKYILQQVLMMDTSEDNEEDQKAEFRPEGSNEAVRKAEALTDVAIKTWADAYKSALDGCRTKSQLAKVRAENAHMMKSPGVPEVTKDYFIEKISALEGTLE